MTVKIGINGMWGKALPWRRVGVISVHRSSEPKEFYLQIMIYDYIFYFVAGFGRIGRLVRSSKSVNPT